MGDYDWTGKSPAHVFRLRRALRNRPTPSNEPSRRARHSTLYAMEGPCGTGKTMAALTAGATLVRDTDLYERMVVVTPVSSNSSSSSTTSERLTLESTSRSTASHWSASATSVRTVVRASSRTT